ncbi:mandelate racemase/muconate lactonizing enzyme family protein [Brucella intermedia]|uniref:mandelate racemase/muconate lactonizing enzyme family protein n=1 Tax=Brucella intermedia TaxID=94625 RepID=UPI00224B053C|nr:mandelate racemase/muconate lactonizing enzyme family protein [Brucella intermedia]
MSLIAAIETIHLVIPFTHDGPPAGFLGEVWTNHELLIVKVTTSDGLIGYGEAFGFTGCATTKLALKHQVAPLLLGKSAEDIATTIGEAARILHVFGRSGAVMYALSAIDIALWDIMGKRAGLPIWKLLGGSFRELLPAYASKLHIGNVDGLSRALEATMRRGYRAVKLHERTLEMVRASRQTIGRDAALMVDVNCAWTLPQAIAAAHSFAPFDIAWLEEPIWPPENHEALTTLQRETGMVLSVGENIANCHDFLTASSVEGLQILQPSVIKVGGISGFVSAAKATRIAGRTIAPHSPYLGPGLLATMQMAFVFHEIEWIEHYSISLETPLYAEFDEVDAAGCFLLPDGPGLGADPQFAALEKYRID